MNSKGKIIIYFSKNKQKKCPICWIKAHLRDKYSKEPYLGEDYFLNWSYTPFIKNTFGKIAPEIYKSMWKFW